MKSFSTMLVLAFLSLSHHSNLQAMQQESYLINFYDLITDKTILAELQNTQQHAQALSINDDEEHLQGMITQEGFKKILQSREHLKEKFLVSTLKELIKKHSQEHFDSFEQKNLIAEITISDGAIDQNDWFDHLSQFLFTHITIQKNQITIPNIIIQFTDYTISLYDHNSCKTVALEKISSLIASYPATCDNLIIRHSFCCTTSLCLCPAAYAFIVPVVILTWVLWFVILANAS